MNYPLTIGLILALYFIFGILSPVIRNIQKKKAGKKLEKNLGGIIVEKFYKKK